MTSSISDFIANTTNNIDNGAGISVNELKDPNAYYNNIPWLSVLGWNGYLMDEARDKNGTVIANKYQGLFPTESVSPELSDVSERGAIDSYNFSLGLNLSDHFYLGLNFLLTDIHYEMFSTYTEYFEKGGYIGLDNELATDGSGIQAKIGVIWRPADWLRLGVAYHSPTAYNLTDRFVGYSVAKYEDVNNKNQTPTDTYEDFHYEYQFSTPQTWVFSAAGVIGSSAIISVDYELKDFSDMKIKDLYGQPMADNEFIEQDFRLTNTLRAGLEYRFTPQFSGRLGMAYAQQPYKQSFRDGTYDPAIVGTVSHYIFEGDVQNYTIGIGYRFTPQFYADAAFVYRTQKDELHYFPGADPVLINNNTMKGLVTLGYKF
jgi:hypothetical protein